MNPINGWEKVQAAQEYKPLPLGAYVVKIMGATVKSLSSRDGREFAMLEISFDIAEGEYAGYYAKDYRAQTGDKRWKGALKLFLPREDGSDQDEWTKSRLKAAFEAIERSNDGYRWDWNEERLKGKLVGCVYRNEQWDWNGQTGFTARPFKFLDVSRIREGDFALPKDKLLKKSTTSNSLDVGYSPIDDDGDLPF